MNKSILSLVAGCSIGFSAAAADFYTVDSRHTFPSFEISHLGFSIQRGRFNETSGKVMLDPKAGKGSVDIAINTASISTGLAELEKHLRGEDFLDAAKYPQIKFISDKLSFSGEKLVAVDGNLTLHGVTRPVRLAVDHFHCGLNMIRMVQTCGANATTAIKRSDFGVDKYVPAVGDEVRIQIQIEAVKD
ncbi:MAG: YceI family protein [Gammaproteobacteria bacterium]